MPLQTSPFGKIRNIHFIGIGGIGMSGIARILHNTGYRVSGSDLRESEMTRELTALGIPVAIGHAASNVGDAQVLVSSSAVSAANPELLAAREQGIPVIQRGEMLAELMRLKFGIAVAGTHGKTTTTAMVSAVLIEGGLSPTSVIGGKWSAIASNAELGKSQYLVCESDESDGSFLKLSPVITVVTNIDLDHMDYYGTEENLLLHFLQFIHKTPFFGKAILCFDDERIRHFLPEVKKPRLTYGFSEGADVRGVNADFSDGMMCYEVEVRGKSIGAFKLPVPGKHNVLNSLAAIAVGLELEIPVDKIRKALGGFQGVNRRMTTVGSWKGFVVMDDYGHHPTEIRATLEALRYKTDRLVVIFQPHRYSRTVQLYKEFAQSFDLAHEVYLTEIYGAGEEAEAGVTSALIHDRMKSHPKAYYFSDREALLAELKKNRAQDAWASSDRRERPAAHGSKSKRPDILLTIGAGDIYKLGQKLAGSGE